MAHHLSIDDVKNTLFKFEKKAEEIGLDIIACFFKKIFRRSTKAPRNSEQSQR